MGFLFLDAWHRFLPREGGHVLSLMGAGGKTSLQRVLGRHYREQGVPVLLTTTTRTEASDDFPAIDWPHDAEFPPDVPDACTLRAGVAPDGKWLGLTPRQVDRLGELLPRHVVVAEVDGAAKLPLKRHRPDEPVWPLRTSLAFVVLGMNALGRPAAEVVHRWGRIEPGPLAGVAADREWDWDCYERLLGGPDGYLDRVPAGVPAVLALLGMGELADSIGLFDFLGRMADDPRLPLVLFGETRGDAPQLRTAYRDEADDAPVVPA